MSDMKTSNLTSTSKKDPKKSVWPSFWRKMLLSRPHIKLKKKRSTKDQIINEIHSLLHGTGTRPYPRSDRDCQDSRCPEASVWSGGYFLHVLCWDINVEKRNQLNNSFFTLLYNVISIDIIIPKNAKLT